LKGAKDMGKVKVEEILTLVPGLLKVSYSSHADDSGFTEFFHISRA
jgi:hypothetical protein